MTENKKIFEQNLNENAKHSGVYMMWLLFREKCDAISTDIVLEKLKKRFGEVDVVANSSGMNMFALSAHQITYQDGSKVPSQVIITDCNEVKKTHGDSIARSQFWDCPGGAGLLDSCKYQVMIGDFMASGLPALERAGILDSLLEIALDLFPGCVAVYVDASGKVMTAENLRNNPYKGALRFMWFGVNARFFNIQGTEDSVVDTLGLYALGLPDVQYHFRGLEPNDVVKHAYNIAIYQFENNMPIKDGDTIGGLFSDSKWKCRYEKSLIQPVRDVLDVDTGEFAAGNRDS